MTVEHDTINVLVGDTLSFTATTSSGVRPLRVIRMHQTGFACRNCGEQWRFKQDAPNYCFFLLRHYCRHCYEHLSEHHEGKCLFAASHFEPFNGKNIEVTGWTD